MIKRIPFWQNIVSNDYDGAGLEARYTVTRRGAPALLVDGYGFVTRKRRGARVYWSCRNRGQGCRARALTLEGRLVACAAHHNHVRQPPLHDSHTRIENLIEIISAVK